MPYPNEHACRLEDPKRFSSMRRTTRQHEGKTYSVIWGLDKKTGTWHEQAYRYDKSRWTATQARSHCTSHDGHFEPASNVQSAEEVGDATLLHIPVAPQFMDAAETDGRNIRLTLYDGSALQHWYWGNLAFDLNGIKPGKSKLPILIDHKPALRIGYAMSSDLKVEGGKLTLQGRLLKRSKLASRIQEELEDGFPFEGSLRFDPARSEMQVVQEGQEVEVNGFALSGPGTVFRKLTIMEGSVTTFGAAPNTSAATFVDSQNSLSVDLKDEPMELTVDVLKKESPDLYQSIYEDGVATGEKRERDAFSKVFEACPDAALAVKAWQEGLSPDKASAEFAKAEAARMKAENEALKKQAEELQQRATAKVDPAVADFKATEEGFETPTETPKGDDAQAATFLRRANELKDAGMKYSGAMFKAAREVPKSYKQWLAEQQPPR